MRLSPGHVLSRLRRWRRERLLRQVDVADGLWGHTVEGLPLLAGLDEAALRRLRELAVLFLHQKDVIGAAGLRLDTPMRLHLATQAVLPVLNLGLEWYRGWRTIVVYPGDFLARHRYSDEIGLEHDERTAMVGEAWDKGPVVLSWSDVAVAGGCDGFNVVIHELAHKLDMLNGDANGYPPLHGSMRPSEWADAFARAYEDLLSRIEHGEEALPLDPYAGESPAEFFSVASESFFECPGDLCRGYPDVYAQLVAFYRQDPVARLGNQSSASVSSSSESSSSESSSSQSGDDR